MFRYPTYPQIWMPPDPSAVLVVKAPAPLHRLDPQTYQALMEERLTWLIWNEIKTEGQSLEAVHQMLSEFSSIVDQTPPDLPETQDPDEIATWCQDWAQALVQGHQIVHEALNQADLSVTPLTKHSSAYSTALELHDATQLSTWLADVQP